MTKYRGTILVKVDVEADSPDDAASKMQAWQARIVMFIATRGGTLNGISYAPEDRA